MNKISAAVFAGITDEEWSSLSALPGMHISHYKKNSRIFHTGDSVCEIGLVLSGCVCIESTDFCGNRSILSQIESGEVFAETYCLCQEPLMVDVTAIEQSQILFLHRDLLQNPIYQHTSWQPKLMGNMLQLSMRKNLLLSNRIFCTSPKTIRERLLTYFTGLAIRTGKPLLELPFDRQQLADYLNVDRSALSKELGKMHRNGLIDYHKSTVLLKQSDYFMR